jgi:hypothetical protein
MNKQFIIFASISAMLFISACDTPETVQTNAKSETEIAAQPEICTDANNPVNIYFQEYFGVEISGFEQYPEEMKCFVAYAVECEHFAGEEGYDEERRQFLHDAVLKYCPEAKARQSALKKKYGQNADMMQVLAVCDDGASAICAWDFKE